MATKEIIGDGEKVTALKLIRVDWDEDADGRMNMQEIAGSEQIYKMAFFAAEAGRAYAVENPDLYHDHNLDDGEPLHFPDPSDLSIKFNLSELQSFSGTVSYRGPSLLPRGSGFEVGEFKAHNYQIVSNGQAPRQSVAQVEEGFYRIGF